MYYTTDARNNEVGKKMAGNQRNEIFRKVIMNTREK